MFHQLHRLADYWFFEYHTKLISSVTMDPPFGERY